RSPAKLRSVTQKRPGTNSGCRWARSWPPRSERTYRELAAKVDAKSAAANWAFPASGRVRLVPPARRPRSPHPALMNGRRPSHGFCKPSDVGGWLAKEAAAAKRAGKPPSPELTDAERQEIARLVMESGLSHHDAAARFGIPTRRVPPILAWVESKGRK